MSNVLLITSSPRGEGSLSSKLARDLAGRLVDGTPGATLTARDLGAEPEAHVDGAFLAAVFAPDRSQLPSAQRAAAEHADTLIDELIAADTIVIGSPMINFGLSTQLKAWFDHVLRAGRTFRYTPAGAEGLVKGKKAYVVVARGSIYSEGALKALDFQEPHLRTLLGFIGITDVEFIRIEGVAISPEQAEKGVAAAQAQLDAIAPAKAIAA
jgi:FMN-dependent NADH-azoreductase